MSWLQDSFFENKELACLGSVFFFLNAKPIMNITK